MILQVLAACNCILGAYDAWITQHRMRAFGLNFELNRLVKSIATRMGPEMGAAIAVFGPVVGWTYIFYYFNLPWALALMGGYGLKRFEIQLQSRVFEKNALQIQKMMRDYKEMNKE